MTHTPGPWGVCGKGRCSCKQVWCGDHPVADVECGEWGDSYPAIRLVKHPTNIGFMAEAYMERISYGEISEETAEANAHLIAAAPKLLEALKTIAETDIEFPYDVVKDMQWIAKQAIAQAEGE